VSWESWGTLMVAAVVVSVGIRRDWSLPFTWFFGAWCCSVARAVARLVLS
jgi:hypothetical protein